MPPSEKLQKSQYCDFKVLSEGIFILITLIAKSFTLVPRIPSFMVACVRYIINTYSIVNVINAEEALWHSTLRNA